MKTLTDYLFESVDNITKMIVETNGDLQFLLLSYDDAIKYFDEYKIFNNKTIIKSGLTKDDIEKAMRDESFIVFDETLATVSFNQDEYPYVAKDNLTGINDVRMNLIKLSSNSEKDFER